MRNRTAVHYHVSCLLDRLAFGSAIYPTATVESVSHWGAVTDRVLNGGVA